MKIDLHCHASERSACSGVSERELIEKAISYGLDAIALTDHNQLVPQTRLQKLNQLYQPFRIFTGIEITLRDVYEDFIVIGIADRLLEKKRWNYEGLHSFVKKAGGYLILAHPFRYRGHVNIDARRFPPDAVELHSINIGGTDEALIRNFARECGAGLVVNSDAHSGQHVGIFYNEMRNTAGSDAELVEQLKAGAFQVRRDEKRIQVYNQGVEENEALIRQMIREGRSAEEYEQLTGIWSGRFERVLMGKSYRI